MKGNIRIAIIKNLAQINDFHVEDWQSTTMLGGDNWEDGRSEFTDFDGKLIKMLYSSKGQAELKKIKNIPNIKKADNTLLVLILSFLLFVAFSEANAKFHFFRFVELAKYNLLKNHIYNLLIVQIPIVILSALKIANAEFTSAVFISFEIYFALFTGFLTVLLAGIDYIGSKTKTTGLYLLTDLLLTTLAFIVSYQLTYLFVRPELLKPGMVELPWLFVPLAVVSYRFYVRYSQQKISDLLREKELELAKQKEVVLKTELLALQSRINPHFLYNALNSIASLVNINAQKTEQMTLALARLFRYNINKGSETISTVEQEIEMVNIYLEVEMVRFADRLKYSIEVEDNVKTASIPVFLLQPLVENAIKHGISKLTENGIISIKIYKEENNLVISVFDNGPAFPADIMTNYGLQSVFDKLSLLYKNNFEVQFINLPDKNIRIRIKN